MARLGLAREDIHRLVQDNDWRDRIDLKLVMSHFVCADAPAAPANVWQIEQFSELVEAFPDVPRSLSNSAGIVLGTAEFDLVRAGIALYGGAPSWEAPNPMAPVVSLDARILQIRDVPAGQGIGYGLTAAASHPRRIATIGIGYADGWPRHLSNRGAVFIDGVRSPIVGRISMDSLMVDMSDAAPSPKEGAMVELLGLYQRIDDVAADADTIAYEILTGLGNRFDRIYQGG